MKLKDIILKIKLAEDVIKNTKIQPGSHPLTVVAKEGVIRKAKNDILNLERNYFEFVRPNILNILFSGEYSASFVETAQQEFDCVSFDIESLMNDLCDVPEMFWLNRTVEFDAIDRINIKLESIAIDANIQSMPMLVFDQKLKYQIKSQEEFVQLVKKYISQQIGGEFFALAAILKLTPILIETKRIENNIPVILYSSKNDEELMADIYKNIGILFKNSFAVSCGKVKEETKKNSIGYLESIDSDNIKKIFKKIKSKI